MRAIVEFGGSVDGLEAGAPVKFHGIKVGRVIDFDLVFDPTTTTFHVPVIIEIEPDRIHLASGDPSQFGQGRLLREFVARGMRAQLKSASLITGQLFVAFDFFPDAPQASIVPTATYPILPTVPNEMENITRSVTATLDRIATLPLDAMVKEIRDILVSVQAVVGSPDVKEAVKRTVPLLESLRKASDAAAVTIRRADSTMGSMETGYGDNSQIRRNLADLTRQLQDTARSIRMLADFVERHPEALIRGKAGTTP